MATKAKTRMMVPVSKRALLARLNRKLNADDEMVKTTRDGTRARQDLGEYYTVDFCHNAIVHADINLEGYGRERGVLADYERLADE